MTSLPANLVIYDVLSFVSALLLAVLILSAICSKHVERGKGWFGMMSCWFLYALSYGLLVGKQSGPAPAFGHCIIQTMLIYAAPPLVSVGTLSFYLEFYLGICWDPSRGRLLGTGVSYLLLGLPWIVHLLIDIEVAILTINSSSNPAVGRIGSGFYCHLNNTTTPGLVSAVVVIIAMILLIPLEVWTGIQLYRSRGIQAGNDFRRYLMVYLRVAGCTVIAVTAFGLSLIAATNSGEETALRNLFFPSLSMAVALIFASQKDLLNAWFRRRSSYFSPAPWIIRSVNHSRHEKVKENGSIQ